MKITPLLFVLLLLCRLCPGQGTWSPITNYPSSPYVADCISFSIGSYGYVGTGTMPPATGSQLFWRYDPAGDSWTQIASLPGPGRWEAVGFAINGKGYCTCGFDGNNMLNDNWEYDPAQNSWTQKNNYPAPNRFEATAFVVQNKAYVTGGQNSNFIISPVVCEYNATTDTWTAKNNFTGTPRLKAISFTADNTGYMGLGSSALGDLNDLWKYDHVNDSWQQMAGFPDTARNDAVAFAICQYGYAGTGSIGSANGLFKNFYRYDAPANSWSAIPDLPGTVLMEATAFVVGDMAYVGTGYNGQQYIPNFYKYDWQDSCLLKTVNEVPPPPFGASCAADPAAAKINFEFHGRVNGAMLSVFDLAGKRLFHLPVSGEKISLSSEALAAGVYLWQLQDDRGNNFAGKFLLR